MLNAKIVILVALGLGSAASSEVQCDPGDIWKTECNTCICSRGGVPKCTARNCHPDAYHVTSTLGSCKPLSRWRVDCNYCTCSEFGVISCTNNICNANDLTSDRFRRQASPTLPSRDACKPGVAWKDDCNRCFCRENGKAECTRLLCFPLDMPERRKRGVDVERASFENAFDYAIRHPFGPGFNDPYELGYEFSQNRYDGRASPQEQECVPGSSWYDERTCNNCFCSLRGVSVCMNPINNCNTQTDQQNWNGQRYPGQWQIPGSFQTPGQWRYPVADRWSIAGQYPVAAGYGQPAEQRFKRLACTKGDSWKEGCNTCYCTQDGAPACTKKRCLPEEETSEKREKRQTIRDQSIPACTEGDTWKQGCNNCFCSQDRTPACTRKLCLPEHQISGLREKRGTLKCKPGTTWRLDCNTCHCTDDGEAACTLKGCPSQTQYYPIKEKREVKKCQPGKKWKDDCNDCVCTHTGYPSCTLKACDSQTYIVPKRKTREVKKCEPGKKWKDDCNDCVCTHTGYPSCTLKACPSQTHILSVKQKRQAKACKPGTSWNDGCNNCFCSETGYAACTLKFCETLQVSPINTSRQKRQSAKSCTPGNKWTEGCNSCYCLAGGTSACTRRLCRRRRDTGQDVRECRPAAKMCGSTSAASESQSRKRDGGKLRGRGRCTPGSTWVQNCSQCYCDEQNNVECVPEESCSDDQMSSQGRMKQQEEGPKGRGRCEPGSTWEIASQRNDWCNLCACDANGIMNCMIRPCQKIENMPKPESETREKRSTRTNKKCL